MKNLYTTALTIIQKLVENGFTAYFAGGWVRDFLMNHPSDDIDIVTNAPLDILPRLFDKTIPVGISFGILIVVENGCQFEVAIFRKEEGYEDGRRPNSIEIGTPEEDAKRRDFTINGMFYDPLNGILYDFVGGEDDLKKGIIRAIGNPHERFQEDRLRMIRAVRYAARFNFAIDPDTLQAILVHAKELFPAVAIERVVQEFVKMEKFGTLQEALLTLHRLHLLQVVFPFLEGVKEREIAIRLKHLAAFPKKAPIIAFLLELFPMASLEKKIGFSLYLKLSKQDVAFVELLHKMEFTDQEDLYAWAYLYAHSQADIARKIHLAKCPTSKDCHASRLEKLKNAVIRIQNNDPVVKSSHLIARGVIPGIELGRFLKEAERIAIMENIEEPEIIVQRLGL
jgi:poly(A) polymerase